MTRAAPLESFAENVGQGGGAETKPPRPPVEPARGPRPTTPTGVGALPRPRDYSRSRAESHALYRVEPDPEDGDTSESLDLDTVDGTRVRRYTAWEMTSGLADDSREADERRAERALRDLRARGKAARSAPSRLPEGCAAMATDPRLSARLCRGDRTAEVQRLEGARVGSP